MEKDFKEEYKVTNLFDSETLEKLKRENEKKESTYNEYEFSRPLGGKRVSNNMSHLVSKERFDELFRTIVLEKK